jgi:LCP family protein required for cell wall assembly
MLEHLDDELDFDLDGSFRQRVLAGARRRQRRRRLAVMSAVVAPAVVAVGAVAYLRDQAGELNRVRIEGLAEPDREVPRNSEEPSAPPGVQPDEEASVAPITTPMNVLIVGTDRRPAGELGGRGDAIAVVRFDPAGGRLAVLSVPRDLWVDTDSGSARISALADDGDPSRLVVAVHDLLGIDIHHYVQIDFAGFERLVDLAGGVAIGFDTAVRDTQTGFELAAGCHRLDGRAALAYVRSRQLEWFEAATGRWTVDPTSDLGRIERQQDVVARVVRTVLTTDYSAADEIRILTDVFDDLTVDPGLTLEGVRALFATARQIGAERFASYDLANAVEPAVVVDNSVLLADSVAIGEIVTDFLTGDAPSSPAIPGAITPAARAC